MKAPLQSRTKTAPTPSFTPARKGVLQRKCACGGTPGPTGECAACQRKRLLGQPKLTVNQPGDRYEQEADRVAEHVMRMPEPRLQRQDIPEEEEEEEGAIGTGERGGMVQTKVDKPADGSKAVIQRHTDSAGGSAISPGLEAYVDALQSGGTPLPETVRSFFEPRFGHDFSRVRIHADRRADEAARAVNARAFTSGRDIVFAAGQYAPDAQAGQRLLAHELTHVVQQRATQRSDPAHSAPISPAPRPTIARWTITGNTATADKKGYLLGNLAKQVTGQFRDWPCIWPTNMQSPKAWDDDYERYIQLGDTFDISNLKATTGTSQTFTFGGAGSYLETAQALYGGTDPIALAPEIGLLAGNGETPIESLTAVGHSGGGSMWGDSTTFTPGGLNPEEPAPSGIGAHNKMGPRRCWFTRNATVRFVGCSSETVANPFANAFLRKGATALGTNHWICGWHQTAPTVARYMSVEGPPCTWPPTATELHSAADVNSAAGLWVTTQGNL